MFLGGLDNGVYVKRIKFASIDIGLVHFEIGAKNFCAEFCINGVANAADSKPLKGLFGTYQMRFRGFIFDDASASVYYKINRDSVDVAFLATTSTDYSQGFVFCDAPIIKAENVRRASFDLSGYSQV